MKQYKMNNYNMNNKMKLNKILIIYMRKYIRVVWLNNKIGLNYGMINWKWLKNILMKIIKNLVQWIKILMLNNYVYGCLFNYSIIKKDNI